MPSRHLELLKSLSEKNREKEEQQRQEECRSNQCQTLLHDRPWRCGANNSGVAPTALIASTAFTGVAVAATEAPAEVVASSASESQQLSVEERRLNAQRCNAAIEKRQEETLRRLVCQQEAARLREERKQLKIQWRAHRAKQYLLSTCRDVGLRDYLESKGKPRALPKLPFQLPHPSNGEPFLSSTCLSAKPFSAECAVEPKQNQPKMVVPEDACEVNAAHPSSPASGPNADKYERNCSPVQHVLLSGTSQQTQTSVDRFIERTRQSRHVDFCSNIDDWKKRNGCCSSRLVFVCDETYHDFRNALLSRGWFQNMQKDSRHFDLKWGMAKDIDHKRLKPHQVVNHFDKSRNLATKVGLSLNLRNCVWHCGVGLEEFYPRAFDLADVNERADFVLDFKFTKAESILRQFVQHMKQGTELTFSEVVVAVVSKMCSRRLTDVDDVLDCPEMAESLANVEGSEWALLADVCLEDVSRKLDRVLKDEDLHEIITRPAPPDPKKKPAHDKEREKEAEQRSESRCKDKKKQRKVEGAETPLSAPVASFANPRGQHLFKQAQTILKDLESKCPQHAIHGTRNAWIVKPAGKSRGRGIQVMRELDEIFQATQSDGFQWVCQKYIEQPQLIHGYKFDIRQWVLVTDWNPLTVYIWQQPYLRFAGQKYDNSLSNLSEYMHLVNNSIIKHMGGFGLRNEDLNASGYMWFRQQYEEWLHATYCKCKHHVTPWMSPPPYTCETFGVKWEDVAFIAKEEEDDEDDCGDPAGNANAKLRNSKLAASPAALSTSDAVCSEERRPVTCTDSEEQPPPQNLRTDESVASAVAEVPCLLNCPCGARFRSRAKLCQKCGTSQELAEALTTAEGRQTEETKAEEPKAGAKSRDSSGELGHECVCENLWDTCIKPQIVDIVTWSLQSVVDNVAHRKNSFELYGYDFMMSSGVDGRPKVWLIEVNSSPACDYSTPVTTPLVKKMMEDTAKVIVDRREDPECDIGEWEFLHHRFAKFVSTRTNAINSHKLEVCGTQIKPL